MSNDNNQPERLIVVAYRIPVTISNDGEGGYDFKLSSGGLVSALEASESKKSMDFIWIGWPGFFIPPNDRPYVDRRLKDEFQCQAVYLEEEVADRYYNGFSNSTLWPLFHSHPGELNFDEDNWIVYREVNLKFAQAVHGVIKKNDFVLIEDYHLILLPVFLRNLVTTEDHSSREVFYKAHADAVGDDTLPEEDVADIKIGYFLHTPFPSTDIYRMLPVRREILLSLLFCDLIGFHANDYTRNFLSSCTRILGLPTMPNGVEFEGRLVHVGTFPIGIDPNSFFEELRKKTVKKLLAALKQRFNGVKVIVSVDRLDYLEGVPQKLHALELFLSQHPEWIGKVVLTQLVVPSREDVQEQQNLLATCNELVGRINSRFGTVKFMPIHFIHKSLLFPELCALYALSDVCLAFDTRDQKRYVPYEYIACQQGHCGVTILSEVAGAAQSLNGCIVVNPWDSQQVADAIYQAVTMPQETREENHKKLFEYIQKSSALNSFVAELRKISRELGEKERVMERGREEEEEDARDDDDDDEVEEREDSLTENAKNVKATLAAMFAELALARPPLDISMAPNGQNQNQNGIDGPPYSHLPNAADFFRVGPTVGSHTVRFQTLSSLKISSAI